MKKSDASQGQSASELISKRIADIGDCAGNDIHEAEEIDESAFKALVRQAVALNRSGKSETSAHAELPVRYVNRIRPDCSGLTSRSVNAWRSFTSLNRAFPLPKTMG